MSEQIVTFRTFWQIIGADERGLRAAERIAKDITVDATTQVVEDTIRGRAADQTTIILASDDFEAWLAQGESKPTITVPLTPVSRDRIMAWLRGEEGIPQWAARALLHNALESAVDDLDFDDEYDARDE